MNNRSEFESRLCQEFHYSLSSKPALGPTQLSIQWIPMTLSPGVKWQRPEADHSCPTNAAQENMDLFHGIVLSELSTETTLLYLYYAYCRIPSFVS
jgi:hypothetical protein